MKYPSRIVSIIPLSKPDITNSEKKAVAEVLETSSLSLGEKYKEFEKIDKDVIKITDGERVVEVMQLERPQSE